MKSILSLLLGLCANSVALAYDPLADVDPTSYVPPAKEWREEAVTVPQTFDPNDLQHFTLNDNRDPFDYAIERKSLHTGTDRVTRFVVVIRSRQGAVNSSYEGLRCGYREYKVYAYGSGQGLTALPDGEWQPIAKGADDYRATLYQNLICNLQSGKANPPKLVFEAMRNGRKVNDSLFNIGR